MCLGGVEPDDAGAVGSLADLLVSGYYPLTSRVADASTSASTARHWARASFRQISSFFFESQSSAFAQCRAHSASALLLQGFLALLSIE